MPSTRPRTVAAVRLDLQAAEQRLELLIARWQAVGTTRSVAASGPTRTALQQVEEIVRQQRGTLDRLHQLWIEYAQVSGQHAPQ